MISPGTRFAWARPLVPLALCLVVVALLVAIRPDPATDFRRSYSDVEIEQIGSLRAFDVEVIEVARATEVPRDGEAFGSAQALIIVTVEASVRTTRTFFGGIALITADDHEYEPRPEFSQAEPNATEPGFSVLGRYVFEVPPSRLDGARLRVDPDGGEFDVYDAAVRVDLGLDGDTPVTTLPGPLPDSRQWVTS